MFVSFGHFFESIRIDFSIENLRIVIIQNVKHIYVILMNVQIVNNNVIYH